MRLSTILAALATGELSHMHYAAGGVIAKQEMPRIISNINLALTDLHTRFLLREDRVNVQAYAGHRAYKLHSGFAQSSNVPEPHIMDAEAPFKDNVLEILRVSYNGCRIPLDKPKGIYTTTPQTMYIDGEIQTEQLYVVEFKADHPRIPDEYMYPVEDDTLPDLEIELPPSHLKALLLYVASRSLFPVTSGLQGDGRVQHEGLQYRKLYEEECLQLQGLGIDADKTDERNLFRERGFI